MRETSTLLIEQAAIEGNGRRGAVRHITGAEGCIVTPLTIESAPLLLALAFGEAGVPAFVSETRNLYRHRLCLAPTPDSGSFEIFRERGREGRRFAECRVTGFELRISRDADDCGSALKLKLDIEGAVAPEEYQTQRAALTFGERFKEDGVTYRLNGQEHEGVYGLTLAVQKGFSTKAEVRIHRILGKGEDLSTPIESLVIEARLFRTRQEGGNEGAYKFGLFRLTLTRLVLMADETTINSTGAVIGPLRYYCAGDVKAEVFTENGEALL